MMRAEQILDSGRFNPVWVSAQSETQRNYLSDRRPEVSKSSVSAVDIAPGHTAEILGWPRRHLFSGSNVAGATRNILTNEPHIVIGGATNVGESSATDIADRGTEPYWIGDLRAVLWHAQQYVSQETHDRLKNLSELVVDEGNVPLQVKAAGWFVHYCICRGIKRRPLMTITPTGELDATWRGGDAETVVMRFFPSGTVWVVHRLKSAEGSFEATVAKLVSKEFPFRFPDWTNA